MSIPTVYPVISNFSPTAVRNARNPLVLITRYCDTIVIYMYMNARYLIHMTDV